MPKKRLGKLPPRYSFLLNPYQNKRLSKCPKCNQLTRLRKFALFIHIDNLGPMVLGKTCRYCPECELIMAHQDELEQELANNLVSIDPDVIGNEYLVLGTVDMKVWRRGLKGHENDIDRVLSHTADFKKYFDLIVEPGGWYPAKNKPLGT
jgi:hypothetical protein